MGSCFTKKDRREKGVKRRWQARRPLVISYLHTIPFYYAFYYAFFYTFYYVFYYAFSAPPDRASTVEEREMKHVHAAIAAIVIVFASCLFMSLIKYQTFDITKLAANDILILFWINTLQTLFTKR